MSSRTYLATGKLLGALERTLPVRLRATGTGHLTGEPTLYVVNHFTRFETLLVPYLLYKETGRAVRTLADRRFFAGPLKRFLTNCGVMSNRDPARNETIVRELMTNRIDWVIYPEGGLVKNRKGVDGRQLHLDLPHRQGPPHTGAAVMALQAEIAKHAYVRACATGGAELRASYERRFALSGPESVMLDPIKVVPVTLTYYPMRSDKRHLVRAMEWMTRKPADPKAAEELVVEGSLVFGECEIAFHFGDPIDVSRFLRGPKDMLRLAMEQVTGQAQDDKLLRAKAKRLTDTFMRQIYGNVEVNVDHLFCWALRSLDRDVISRRALRDALFIAARRLGGGAGSPESGVARSTRLHPTLQAPAGLLVSGAAYGPLKSIEALAVSEGIVRIEGDSYVINRDAIERQHDFQTQRLDGMTQVIANELEPSRSVVEVIASTVNKTAAELRHEAAVRMHRLDRGAFVSELVSREEAQDEGAPPVLALSERGRPFMLEGDPARAGVVLTHGYLACPEEMRPLANHLNRLGHSVYVVRLEGHGTSPEELPGVEWERWVESVMRGYAVLQDRCTRVVTGGLSLGGVLALHAAARARDGIGGVFTINAPMGLRDWRARLVPLVLGGSRAARTLRLSGGDVRRVNRRTESPDINYPVDYLSGVQELRAAMKHCRRLLAEVMAPALIIQSESDPVIAPTSGDRIYRDLGSTSKQLVRVPSDRHIIVRDGDETAGLFDRVSEFVGRQSA